MKNIHIVFSIRDIEKLKVKREHNKILNESEFIDNVIGRDVYNNIRDAYHKFRSVLEYNKVEDWVFNHELFTLLLNAKYQSKYSIQGMRYGFLCLTIYQNNIMPNLIEISLCVPMYELHKWFEKK